MTDLVVGDFVAFSYSPVDILNDIVKTPQQAKEELQQVFDLTGDKKVGIFEISWSTSNYVGGSNSLLHLVQNTFRQLVCEFVQGWVPP